VKYDSGILSSCFAGKNKLMIGTVRHPPMDADHDIAKADDGADDGGTNVTPRPHDKHVKRHKDNGDFSRWAKRRWTDPKPNAPKPNPTPAPEPPPIPPPPQPEPPPPPKPNTGVS
jgi:hypothetical protein